MANDINHSTIYNWFDRCGVISNIRTQLRQNLIDALKSKDLTLTKTHVRSAKQYVYDLLIGEYLLKTNFAYTLSVFTSEAPLPAYFDQLLTRPPSNSDDSDVKLQNDYLQHVLESLGINPQDSLGHLILSTYAKRDESLLICLLQCLKWCSYENEKTTVSSKEKTTQTEDVDNCERCKHLIHVKKKLIKQKEEFDQVLVQKSEKLKNQAQFTEQQLVLLQEKMDQAQALMNSLNAKRKHFAEEQRIEQERNHQMKLQLVHKEEFLTREINRLELERSSYKQFEENLQRVQNELTRMKRGQNNELKTNYETRDVQVQTEGASFSADWNEKELLQREKEDLASLVHEQQLRISQLTHRAVQLSRQLEQAQLVRTTVPPVTTKLMGTFMSEGSSTEDILLDAKTRLKRLERESEEAEQRYHDYVLKTTLTI